MEAFFEVVVPEFFKARLRRVKVSQLELAGVLGMSEAEFSRRVNHGVRPFTEGEVEKILRVLGSDVASIFREITAGTLTE